MGLHKSQRFRHLRIGHIELPLSNSKWALEPGEPVRRNQTELAKKVPCGWMSAGGELSEGAVVWLGCTQSVKSSMYGKTELKRKFAVLQVPEGTLRVNWIGCLS